MKRDYILINGKKLDIPNWGKWAILYLVYNITILAIHTAIITVGIHIGVEPAIMRQVAYYIDAFIILTFIHDLAPKFKKTFSMFISFFAIFFYVAEYNLQASLPAIIFIAIIILYNILLYKKFA
ncbi:hypothetical protein [Clostridium uliginosum]|uniref:Uncharacterized protein n=1 Tax=Clostridium uliginosum TaxID=119641 RepID=A0A1I1R2I0_9CLOT|nr:hypothetical protein [Clostridium uliginosum]SFD28417.1 hypothetical protein SAMN05421842_12943 [Clostridium uliginosum]